MQVKAFIPKSPVSSTRLCFWIKARVGRVLHGLGALGPRFIEGQVVPTMVPHPPLLDTSCAWLYLAEFVEQFWNASQPLCGPLEVPVLKHQLHHLRVSSADCLLQDWGHQLLREVFPMSLALCNSLLLINPAPRLGAALPSIYLPSPGGSLCPRWHCAEGGLSQTPGFLGTQPAPGESALWGPPVQCCAEGDGHSAQGKRAEAKAESRGGTGWSHDGK